MSRFSAATLDLSRFPAPLAIRGVDYEAILAARKTKFIEYANARGFAYDAQSLEVDAAVILEEADAYREMLVISDINDRVRSVMIAFAVGSDLDHLAAFYGIDRPVIGYGGAGNTLPIYMGDTEFRRQVLLAPEAFSSAGAHGGYVFHSLRADARVINVDPWKSAPGEVTVAIQSREGDGIAPDDLVEAVRARLHDKAIKPLTDVVNVRSIVNVPFSVTYQAYALPGPDPQSLKTQIDDAILAEAAKRRTPARDMPRSALIGAGQVDALDRFDLLTPATNIARGYGEVALLTSLTGEVITYDG